MDRRLHVISGGLTGDAALDTATSRAILQRVSNGELPATLQVAAPHRVLAFGKHDSIGPQFREAVDIAVRHGYDPTVRIAGGRAVVFHTGTVRFAWTVPEDEPATTMHDRFTTLADAVVATLGTLGVATEIGELPNEYCPGSYSVHLVGGGKIMGVGQRLTRSAAQVGGMIVVNDSESINAVLGPIYRELSLSFDPAMTGALAHVADLEPGEVASGLAHQLAADDGQIAARIDPPTASIADSLRVDHVPSHLRHRAEPS